MTPTEKLVQQIQRALTEPPDRVTLERLAADYTAQCQAANRRLEQCEAMMTDGNENQVIQLAETSPPLLDQIATLSFEQCEEWRTRCRAGSLPVPEPFNERAISKLGELYEKGISAQHPLYRDYREAVLKRDDERALAVLRSILRFNKADTVAKSECERLEGKLRDQKIAELDKLLQKNDTKAALDLFARMETLFRAPPLAGPAVERARALRKEAEREDARRRCEELIASIQQLQQANNWRQAFEVSREVDALCQQHNPALPKELAAKYQQTRAWAGELKTRFEEEQRYQQAIQQFTQLSQPGRAGKRSRQAIEEEMAALAAKRSEVELFGRPLPEELEILANRRAAELQHDLKRRKRARAVMAVFTTLAVLAAAAGGVFWYLHEERITNAVNSVKGYLDHNRIEAAAEAFAKIPADLTEHPKIVAQRIRLRRLQGDEDQRIRDAEVKVAQLERYLQGGFTNAAQEEIEKVIPEAHTNANAVITTPGRALKDRVSQVETAFHQFLKNRQESQVTQRDDRRRKVRESLEKLQAQANKLLAAGATLDKVRQGQQQISDGLLAANRSMQEATDDPNIIPECVPLKGQIESKLNPIIKALAEVTKAEADLRKAQTIEEFWTALGALAGEQRLADVAEMQAAQRAAALKPKLGDIAEQLLMPDNAKGWKSFKANPKAELYPSTDIPQDEANKILVWQDDKFLYNVHRYQLPPGARSTPPFPPQGIYTLGPGTISGLAKGSASINYRFSVNAFVPHKDAEKADFALASFSCESRNLDGGPTEPQGERAAECSLFIQHGFKSLADPQSNKYRKSILPMLDAVCAARDISPLYRAYLHYQLLDLLNVRPQAWGGQWDTGAAEHLAKLKDLGVPDLRSGDWMVPSRIELYEKKLSDFYKELGPVSYLKQVRSRQVLTQKAFDAGFTFAGYAGYDGALAARTEGQATGELWGFASDGAGKLTRLFRLEQGKPVAVPPAKPQPLTPLFLWKTDRATVMRDTAKAAGVPVENIESMPGLPPLFQ